MFLIIWFLKLKLLLILKAKSWLDHITNVYHNRSSLLTLAQDMCHGTVGSNSIEI